MLKIITSFFEKHIKNSHQTETDNSRALNLATAALFIEMINIDNNVTLEEEKKLHDLLISEYQLSVSDISEITNLAKQQLKDATDYYQFTQLINQHFEQPQKIQMIEDLWQLAFADGNIDSFEEHYLRKIADLLFVPHSEFIKAKLRVID